ncbi:MAG: hypothetical protein ACREOM_03890, partial [Candidatus Dormibacteraceae bacterium]
MPVSASVSAVAQAGYLHRSNCRESENRGHARLFERCELELLRERIRSESVTFIGSEHPTDEEGGTMRHVDP